LQDGAGGDRVEAVGLVLPTNVAASPDGEQVWITLKDIGRVQVFDAKPPFKPLKTIASGPITNHVNFVRNRDGQF
jgi:DNA-binding beta-propeller fold protein YncE